MFVCSLCSMRAKAAVFASVRISDPPVHLLICCGRRLKLVATRPALLNHIAGRDPLRDPKLNSSVYSATKGAVDVISRALALELAPRKIRVNSLSPGATDTEGVRALEEYKNGFEQMAITRTPLGRIGTAEDIAKAALFLASEDSGWVTGEELLVGGGIRL